jgi:hypothetical protein
MKENEVDEACSMREGDEKFIHSLGQKITRDKTIWKLDDNGRIF